MISIGFVSVDEQGLPVRKPRSGYSFHTQDQKGYHPPRVYKEENMAKRNSPVGQAKEVYVPEG